MLPRRGIRFVNLRSLGLVRKRCSSFTRTTHHNIILAASPQCCLKKQSIFQGSPFHTSTRLAAQGPTADALMENLNDLYATAKDEFEIAAEETEKKTVYASDDRDAAKAALDSLKEAFEKAVKESDPEVAKEVQSRTGQRIRELENAVTAMEEMAMED